MSARAMLGKPLTRRNFLGVLATIAGGALVASCKPAAQPATQPTTAPAAVGGGTQEMSWVMWTWDGQHLKFVGDRIDAWSQSNGKYKATLDGQQMPYADLYTKVLANLASGSGAPDILPIELNVFARFMKGNIAEKTLVEITDLIAPERDKFIESRWINFTINGKTYGIDNGYNPGGYWYQPEIFRTRPAASHSWRRSMTSTGPSSSNSCSSAAARSLTRTASVFSTAPRL